MAFIDKEFCHIKSAVGMQLTAVDRKAAMCSWAQISVKPEMLVRSILGHIEFHAMI